MGSFVRRVKDDTFKCIADKFCNDYEYIDCSLLGQVRIKLQCLFIIVSQNDRKL